MAELYQRRYGRQKPEPVNERNPLVVEPMARGGGIASIVALGRLYSIRDVIVPGITVADALDANDAFGTVFALPVPKAGAIVKAGFHDLDAEGIAKHLWMLNVDPTTNAAASDAAFTVVDGLAHTVVGVLDFSSFSSGAAGKFSMAANTPLWYTAPLGYLWCQLQTDGADNIADGSLPRVSLLIERYDSETGL